MSAVVVAILVPLMVMGYVHDKDHSHRLVACMQLTRYLLMEEQEKMESLVEQSHFGKEDVLTKAMAEMLTHCIETIPLENTNEIIYAKEGSQDLKRFSSFVPIPEYPYLTEEALRLTDNEAEIITEILEKTKKAEEAKKRGKPRMEDDEEISSEGQNFGTSLGLIYILAVFCVLAGIVGYGIMRMENQKLGKKEKKKSK